MFFIIAASELKTETFFQVWTVFGDSPKEMQLAGTSREPDAGNLFYQTGLPEELEKTTGSKCTVVQSEFQISLN